MSERANLRSRLAAVALLVGAAAIGVGLACIIPDADIQVLVGDVNAYPVRFVEGIPLDEEARCACSADSCECPMPGVTGIPTYLDPEDTAYKFCICGDDEVDEGRLYGVEIYVEDQDEEDGVPSDSLYAAALLDWDPTTGDSPFEYVAYRSYLDPGTSLALAYSSYEPLVIKRPRPYARKIILRDPSAGGRFDLCNGAGVPVGPGYHTLTLIVTDRPWFQREAGVVETTEAGETGDPLETGPVTLDGVPDIAAGATYDMRTYVFMCHDQETDPTCACTPSEN
jgi:hypothetical protein